MDKFPAACSTPGDKIRTRQEWYLADRRIAWEWKAWINYPAKPAWCTLWAAREGTMGIPDHSEPAVVRATNGADVLGIIRQLAPREPNDSCLLEYADAPPRPLCP